MGDKTKRINKPANESTLDQHDTEGRADYFMDNDRMVNEGLGGGRVTEDNGMIEKDIEVAKESKGNPNRG